MTCQPGFVLEHKVAVLAFWNNTLCLVALMFLFVCESLTALAAKDATVLNVLAMLFVLEEFLRRTPPLHI